jgi:hypothetical protein
VLADGTQRILYTKVIPGKGGEIWSVPVNGGAATQVTTGGASSCGNSFPTWSANGQWIAWAHEAKKAEGTCGASSVFVQNQRTGVKTQVPTVTVEEGTLVPVKGRLSFTADSRYLSYQVTGAFHCYQTRGVYELATRAASASSMWGCDNGPEVWEWVPAPSGNDALVWTIPKELDFVTCLSAGTVFNRCLPNNDPKAVWQNIDVQPIPAP